MKKVNTAEMREVVGGASIRCACGRVFNDTKFLWWVISSAKSNYTRHKNQCWTRGYSNSEIAKILR